MIASAPVFSTDRVMRKRGRGLARSRPARIDYLDRDPIRREFIRDRKPLDGEGATTPAPSARPLREQGAPCPECST